MNWNLFWNAFGAIGTTIGSLITAIAVVVAVKQYMQPLEKRVKVEFSSAVSNYLGKSKVFYCVSVKNRGVRLVEINSISIKGNKQNIWINNAQSKMAMINIPVRIEQEECQQFLFEIDDFREIVKKSVEDKVLKKRMKLVIIVTDSLGDDYLCKTRIKISSLIKKL